MEFQGFFVFCCILFIFNDNKNREIFDVVKKSLETELEGNGQLDDEWFENFANVIFAKKRRKSLVDLTKVMI